MLKRASFQKRFAAFTILFMLFQILSPFGSLIGTKGAKADTTDINKVTNESLPRPGSTEIAQDNLILKVCFAEPMSITTGILPEPNIHINKGTAEVKNIPVSDLSTVPESNSSCYELLYPRNVASYGPNVGNLEESTPYDILVDANSFKSVDGSIANSPVVAGEWTFATSKLSSTPTPVSTATPTPTAIVTASPTMTSTPTPTPTPTLETTSNPTGNNTPTLHTTAVYTISTTASPSDGGWVTASPDSVNSGDSSTITATPINGHSFFAWSGDCSWSTASSVTLTDIRADKTCTAIFSSTIIEAPEIVALSLSNGTPTRSTANIRWNTNIEADSVVEYGTVPGSYEASMLTMTPTLDHLVQITGLTPLTTYYYRVTSSIYDGEIRLSAVSEEANFETAAADTNIVSFDSNAGSVVDSIPAETDATITEPTEPTRGGLIFAGWYKDADLLDDWVFGVGGDTVTEDIPLYAKWDGIPITYQVTFNSDGGTPIDPIIDIVPGTKINEPNPPPEKSEYTFGGWWTGQWQNIPWNFDTDVVNTGITLTARWYINTYNVYADASPSYGGTAIASPDYVESGGSSTITATANNGYSFFGWVGDCSGGTNPYIVLSNITTDQSCTAVFSSAIISAPSITSVTHGTPTRSTANIRWDTDVEADSTVEYGTVSGEYDTGLFEMTPTKDHLVQITDLEPATTYYYKVTSTIYDGLMAKTRSSNEGEFTTAAAETNIVVFVSSGGSIVDPIVAVVNAYLTPPTPPTRPGYVFSGWYRDDLIWNLPWDFDNDTVQVDTVLYAKWTSAPVETVNIDTQAWMTRNLNVGTMVSADIVALEFAGSTNGGNRVERGKSSTYLSDNEKWCYGNNEASCDTYGGLYSWNTAMIPREDGATDICPVNFHVPSDTDWTTLTDYLGTGNSSQLRSESSGGDNSSGFNGLLAGFVTPPNFNHLGTGAYFLSSSDSTEMGDSYSSDHSLFDSLDMTISPVLKSDGSSIRCLQDAPVIPATYTVNYNTVGGSEIDPVTEISRGDTIMEPVAPSRNGYTFGGWYHDEALNDTWNFDTDTVIANTTLFAKWTANPTPTPDPTVAPTLTPNPTTVVVALATSPTPTPTPAAVVGVTTLPAAGANVLKMILNMLLAILVLSLGVIASKKTKYAYLLS